MRHIIRIACLLAMVSCQQVPDKSIQSIAENNAREFLLKNMNDPDSYSPVEFSRIDTSIVLDLLLKDQVFNANFRNFIKTADIGNSIAMDNRKKEMIVEIVNLLSDYSTNMVFKQALENASVNQKDNPLDFITLFGESFEEIEPNASLAAIFNTVNLKDKIKYYSTNEEVLEVIRKEFETPTFAIEHSFRAKNAFGALMVYKYRIDFDNTLSVVDMHAISE